MRTSPSRSNGIAAATLASALLIAPAVPALAATSSHGRAIAPGRAATVRVGGVVVAQQQARQAVVVASEDGVAKTLRVTGSSAFSRLRPGVVVRALATRLGDGTYRVKSIATSGHLARTRLRGTVLESAGAGLLLSTGGSIVSIARSGPSLRPHVSSSSGSPTTGSVVSAGVAIVGSSLVATAVQQVGQSDLIELEGTLSSLSSGQLVVAVDNGATTTVSIPTSITVPSTIIAGDRVELLVYYSNQSFGLVTITDENSAARAANGDGTSQPASTSPSGLSQAVQVEGTIVTAGPTTLVVQPGEGAAAVTFAIPAGFDLTGVTTGARVQVTGDLVNGVLTVQQVDLQASASGDGQGGDGGSAAGAPAPTGTVSAVGKVSSLDQTTLVLQPGDGAAVTFAVPAGFDLTGITVGVRVAATGSLVSGVLTLQSAVVSNDQHKSGGDGSGSGSPAGTGSGNATGSGSGNATGSTGSGSGDATGGTGSGSGNATGSTGSGSGSGNATGSTGSGSGNATGSTGSGSGSATGSTGSGSGNATGSTGSQSGSGSDNGQGG